MTTTDAQPPAPVGEHPTGLSAAMLWCLGLIGLIVLFVVVTITIAMSLGGSSGSASSAEAAPRNLAPYWTVRTGDTYTRIARRTGLSIDQLETFNPYTDPSALNPGQRVKLRLKAPPPAPKRLGPRYWKVRSGQSFGSIAASTGRPISVLRSLNPGLKPTALQPGDRMRLRR